MATRKTKRFENKWQIWPEYDKNYNAIVCDFSVYNLIENEEAEEQYIRGIYKKLKNHLKWFITTTLSTELKSNFILIVDENGVIVPGKKYGLDMNLTAALANNYKKKDAEAMMEMIGEAISNEATSFLEDQNVKVIEKVKKR